MWTYIQENIGPNKGWWWCMQDKQNHEINNIMGKEDIAQRVRWLGYVEKMTQDRLQGK